MKNYYAAAIDLLMNYQGDWKEVAVELAKRNPSIFIECVQMAPPNLKAVHMEAVRIAAVEGKVPAIKYLRAKLDLGLKEAKVLIESLTTDFHQHYRS